MRKLLQIAAVSALVLFVYADTASARGRRGGCGKSCGGKRHHGRKHCGSCGGAVAGCATCGVAAAPGCAVCAGGVCPPGMAVAAAQQEATLVVSLPADA